MEGKKESKLKTPAVTEFPKPEDRIFDNQIQPKPQRKLQTLDIKFGDVTEKNVELLRILNYTKLPVVYSEDFYKRLTMYMRYSKLAYLKDVLVGAISCKEDFIEEEGKEKEKVVYIMTITVLDAYKRYKIGSQLLEKAVQDCCKSKQIKKIYLHVQKGNDSAMEFYKHHGFSIKEELKDYYTDLEPADCFVLIKEIEF